VVDPLGLLGVLGAAAAMALGFCAAAALRRGGDCADGIADAAVLAPPDLAPRVVRRTLSEVSGAVQRQWRRTRAREAAARRERSRSRSAVRLREPVSSRSQPLHRSFSEDDSFAATSEGGAGRLERHTSVDVARQGPALEGEQGAAGMGAARALAAAALLVIIATHAPALLDDEAVWLARSGALGLGRMRSGNHGLDAGCSAASI